MNDLKKNCDWLAKFLTKKIKLKTMKLEEKKKLKKKG